MRKLWVALFIASLIQGLSAATVTFTVTPLGMNNYRDTYNVSGFTFQANQELDIFFDPTLYTALTNGHAPTGYDLLVIQPDPKAMFAGDYSALALVNSPPNGPFNIDFTFLGSGQPGSLPFTISSVDENGMLHPITSGQTTPSTIPGIPEPASISLAAIGGAMVWLAARRKSWS
jgi:hypothetical protein